MHRESNPHVFAPNRFAVGQIGNRPGDTQHPRVSAHAQIAGCVGAPKRGVGTGLDRPVGKQHR